MSLPDVDTPAAFLAAPPRLRRARIEMTEDEAVASVANDNPLVPTNLPKGTRAVLYLRVSSKGQVETDYDPEGISLPAQRISCTRKADQLGLTVVGEYVEPGRSGTEMSKRIEFQRMLERISRQKDVDFVIVHDLSRFARNRIDDAIVMADLRKRGVTLISATESIDATPVGQLMHGLLAAFNEYRSAKDGAEVSYKMGQKAKSGGTLGRAPLGYLNVTENIDGRKVNTVAIDPERAPFVKLAFELYAAGKMTFQDIADELTDRGLLTRATARFPAGPVSDSKIEKLLRDRYYLGEVSYRGEYFEGRHDALIESKLFDRVQELLETRGYANERRRKHDHYLKGTIWCGRCYLEAETNRRMILMHVNKQSATYSYFFCRGTQDHTCDTPYSNIDRVEEAIERHYKTITLRPEFVAAVHTLMEAAVNDQVGAQRMLQEQARTQLKRLTTQEDNLIDLAADGAIDSTRVRSKLRDIARQRKDVEAELETMTDDLTPGMEYIDAHLDLLTHPYELYRHASDLTRRMLNQAIFTRIYVVNEEVVGDELNTPMRELLAEQRAWSVFQETGDDVLAREVAHAEARRHAGIRDNEKQATVSDGLLDDFVSTLLSNGAETVGSCSTPSMVRPKGLEPLTF